MASSTLQVGMPAPRWLCETGPDSDIAISTRCRMARNLAEHTFPWRASERERREVAQSVLEAVDGSCDFDRSARVSRDRLSAEEINRLIELRLASAHWWDRESARWLVVCQDGVRSLIVNEEDHLRLQAIMPGLQVESCLSRAETAERQLGERLQFAWSADVGFLTASLTNAGTGIRLSVMLHLPALAATDKLASILSAAAGLGCSVRGAYGEGSSATGALYQVSNTRACFVETYRIVDRVRAAARYLINTERESRRTQFGDAAGRLSLREATADVLRLLFEEEAGQGRLMGMVSVLRLAVSEGILPVGLPECAEWITIAGAAPAPADGPSSETFHAIQRTATIRQRVRTALRSSGTFVT